MQALVGSGLLPLPLRDRLRRLRRRAAAAAAYRRQRRAFNALGDAPAFALVLPLRTGDAAAVRRTVASVRKQTYGRWELYLVPSAGVEVRPEDAAAGDRRVRVWDRPTAPAIGGAANYDALVRANDAAFIGFVGEGDELAPSALFHVADLLRREPELDVVYTDEARLGAAEEDEPTYKPDWAPEHLLTQPYVGRLCAYRRTLVATAGGLRDGPAAEYDLLLRLAERGARVGHVREPLYRYGREPVGPEPGHAIARAVAEHLIRIDADADVALEPGGRGHRVRYRIRGAPTVSIVIPTAGMTRDVSGRRIDLLANCVRSIVDTTDYARYEVVYVDNGDLRAGTAAALAAHRGAPVRGVTYSGPFNVAAKMNLGAEHASGEHLLFLNDDVEVIDAEWVTAMLEYSQQRAIGAVGAKLYFPNGAIQHAGVIVPPVGSPAHVYHAFPPARQGGIPDLDVARNYSAVTGACMMTRAEVFREVGGFDPGFPVNYNDVDYCLKVRERDYRVIYTPYARLYHFESVSRVGSADGAIRPEELQRFAQRWAHVAARDPYHDMRRTSVWLGA